MERTGLPVKISLKTHINQDGVYEDFELIVFGHYYLKGDSHYLKYEEVTDSGSIHSLVKISENRVMISRRGAVNMRLVLIPGYEMTGTFQTEQGTFVLSTETKAIEFTKLSNGQVGHLQLKYQLFMEHIDVGLYQLDFTFKEAKQ
ncbi:DUF1934 domain-containing protein [Bacillus kwashiorkori]|uniref:DUF1934 domain-containing protein n=1 Tax=Bacillus kwashiorkori TaxID=1522318 RepID=UPI00078426B7|nr:DUF1934 domain-containing protein [Bacillus kwashiorkori]